MPRRHPLERDILAVETADNRVPFLINGEALDSILDRVLAKSPEAYQAWRKPGGYLPMAMRCPDNYHTDDPDRGAEGFDVPLFCCNCGHSGCAAVMVHIVMGWDTVTWQSFHISGLVGPAPGVGPFIFDRRQYERVLGIEPSIPGLCEIGWHLGTQEFEEVYQALTTALRALIADVIAGAPLLKTPDAGKQLEELRKAIRMPPDAAFEYYRLVPRDYFDFETGEAGSVEMGMWGKDGPIDWVLVASVFYDPEGPQLRLSGIRHA